MIEENLFWPTEVSHADTEFTEARAFSEIL